MRCSARSVLATVLLALYPLCGTRAQNLTLSGFVLDSRSGRPIVAARVTLIGSAARTDAVTDSEGAFVLSLAQKTEQGTARIRVEKPGYLPYDKLISVPSAVPQKIFLCPPSHTMSSLRSSPSTLPSKNVAPTIKVTDRSGKGVSGVEILVLRQNGTHLKELVTDEGGLAEIHETVAEPVVIYCAHPSFHHYYKNSVELGRNLVISMNSTPNGGSKIIVDRTGSVPGLEGTFEPFIDPSGTTYLYTHNIAIEGGRPQPVPFVINRPIRAEDSNGNRFQITIVSILGSSSLIEYAKTPGGVSTGVSMLHTPGHNNAEPRAISITTSGDGEHEYSVNTRPERIFIDPPSIAVRQSELPKEIEVGTHSLTIVRFTDSGLVLDGHGIEGVSLKVSILEAR